MQSVASHETLSAHVCVLFAEDALYQRVGLDVSELATDIFVLLFSFFWARVDSRAANRGRPGGDSTYRLYVRCHLGSFQGPLAPHGDVC